MGIRHSETTVPIVEPFQNSIDPLSSIDLNGAPVGRWKDEHLVCFGGAACSGGKADGRPLLPRQGHHRINGVLRAPNDVPMRYGLKHSGGGPSAADGTAGVWDDEVSLPLFIMKHSEAIECKAIKDAEPVEVVTVKPFAAKVSSVETISAASVFQRRSHRAAQCNVGLSLSSRIASMSTAIGVVGDGFGGEKS